MLKKYLSLLLAFCMIFTSVLAVNAEDVAVEETTEEIIEEVATDDAHAALVEKMQAIGLISDEFNLSDPNATISRIDFVKILLPFLGYEDLVASSIEEDVFADISKDYAGAGYVKASKDLGYLTGYEDNFFYPDAPVEFNEVVKSLVNGLGYGVKAEFYGEYPTGSLAAAREIGLLRGVDVTEKAINKNFLKLLDNALTIPVYEVVSSGEYTYYQTGKDFLADRHDMYIIKAPVNATNVTSLGTTSFTPADKVNIGGIVLEADETLGVDAYLGYKVDAYYHKVKGDSFGTLLYFAESEDNFVKEILSEDIRPNNGEFSAYRFVYYDEQIEETDSLDIELDATVIVNGKAKALYSKEDLAPAYGDVKLIDNDADGRIETVIVFKATAIVHVNNVSVVGNEITFGNNLGTGNYTIYEKDTKAHYIIYKDGNVATVGDIPQESTLVIGRSEDNSYDVVKVSTVFLPGTADGEDDNSVSIDGEYYELGDNYVTLAYAGTSEYAKMKTSRDAEGNIRYDENGNVILTMIDITGTFYVDYQGKIQAVKETTDDSLLYGFILAADDPTDSVANKTRRLADKWKFRILGEDGKIRTLTIPDKININGNSKTADYAINLINNPTQTDGIYKTERIPWSRNNDGAILGYVTPNVFRTNNGQFPERQVCKFKFNTETNEVKELWFQGSEMLNYDGEWIYNDGVDSHYHFYQGTWQRKYYADKIKVFYIREDEALCEVGGGYDTEHNQFRAHPQPDPAEGGDTANAIYFYDVDESLSVGCGVQFLTSSVSKYGSSVGTAQPYIVKNKIQGVVEGLPVAGIKLMSVDGDEKTIYVGDKTQSGVISLVNMAKPGDMLLYKLDDYGAISSIRYVFKSDGNLNHYDTLNIGKEIDLKSCINADFSYDEVTETVSMVAPTVKADLSLLPSSGGHAMIYGVVERFVGGKNLVFRFPGNPKMNFLLRERIGSAKVGILDYTNPSEPVIKLGLAPSSINVGDTVLMYIHNTYEMIGGEPLHLWIVRK